MLLVWTASTAFPADEGATALQTIVKRVRAGDQEALGPFKDLHGHKLVAAAVLNIVTDKRVSLGIKLRLAEIIAAWPDGESRKAVASWLLRHPNCDDDELLFFAKTALLETRPFFQGILTQIKGPLSAVRQPERIAIAAKALSAFQDHSEAVVARIAALLDPANAHVMRACAAEALGGMRHVLALQALISQFDDEAIGPAAHCSFYRLTGQDFTEDSVSRAKAWLAAQGSEILWKMHTPQDHANYLKLQKLLKPLEESAPDMASFYGVRLRAKGALFILDVSGSMDTDDRIGRLRVQMSRLLTAMRNKPPTLRYGILTFGDDIDSCFSGRGMAENTEKNHKTAARFVDHLIASGGTPMCGALSEALNRIAPGGNIDAIYFLSDGAPSDGSPAQVLDLALRLHEQLKITVHTFSIGEEPAPDSSAPSLLQQIANACGGTFTIPP